ncbi:hypothetical protein EVAR_89811_1 [Eumeta japonica]|uniref:Uncharacterized protein n=1 Tax=Eumeta variegata TaxID=151549 RepID=A0A4C1YKF0_EUMVA|nr:hypothetical protein EVAR_89811_1 [Eumeta japonica]
MKRYQMKLKKGPAGGTHRIFKHRYTKLVQASRRRKKNEVGGIEIFEVQESETLPPDDEFQGKDLTAVFLFIGQLVRHPPRATLTERKVIDSELWLASLLIQYLVFAQALHM